MLMRLAKRLLAMIMSINLMNKILKALNNIDKCIKLLVKACKSSQLYVLKHGRGYYIS